LAARLVDLNVQLARFDEKAGVRFHGREGYVRSWFDDGETLARHRRLHAEENANGSLAPDLELERSVLQDDDGIGRKRTIRNDGRIRDATI
jgi:hypothetical protein